MSRSPSPEVRKKKRSPSPSQRERDQSPAKRMRRDSRSASRSPEPSRQKHRTPSHSSGRRGESPEPRQKERVPRGRSPNIPRQSAAHHSRSQERPVAKVEPFCGDSDRDRDRERKPAYSPERTEDAAVAASSEDVHVKTKREEPASSGSEVNCPTLSKKRNATRI